MIFPRSIRDAVGTELANQDTVGTLELLALATWPQAPSPKPTTTNTRETDIYIRVTASDAIGSL